MQDYWTGHTVNSSRFHSARESVRYLDRRARMYPLFRQHMDIPGRHDDEVVVDYGCGPGDDLVEFVLGSGAVRVVGVDVSQTALQLAAARLSLHEEAAGRVELFHVPEGDVRVPLDDASVDYIHCGGVIQHTTDPARVLRELKRVVKPTGRGRVMVYNRDSIWFHLFVAHLVQLRKGRYADLSTEAAFARTTDGDDCPISRCYAPAEFVHLCEKAGFEAEFVGGYFHRHELRWMRGAARARADERLASEHREFLAVLEHDDRGFPLYRGKHAGVGGSYVLRPA